MPAQWTSVAQNISASLGLGGDVREVQVENTTNYDLPIHFSYDFQKPEYSDWANRRILPPLPPLRLGYPSADDKSSESVHLGGTGKHIFRATIELPDGYSAQLPTPFKVPASFAEYSANYNLDQRTLTVERAYTVLHSKIGYRSSVITARSPMQS